MARSVVYSLGLAPVFTLTNDLIIGKAPPERAGAASAISETSSELGGALGIAILGSVGTAIYRGRMADALPPPIPREAAEAARGTPATRSLRPWWSPPASVPPSCWRRP